MKVNYLAIFALIVGVILGQWWAYVQNDRRIELCNKYGMYCEEDHDVYR